VTGQPVTEGGGCPLPAEGAYTAFTVHLAGLPGFPRTVAAFCRHHGPSSFQAAAGTRRQAVPGPVREVAEARLGDLTAALDRVPPGGLYLRTEWFDGGPTREVRCDGPDDAARLDDPEIALREQAIRAEICRLVRLAVRANAAGPIGNERAVMDALQVIARDVNRFLDHLNDQTERKA
jgi:hypothetical protein